MRRPFKYIYFMEPSKLALPIISSSLTWNMLYRPFKLTKIIFLSYFVESGGACVDKSKRINEACTSQKECLGIEGRCRQDPTVRIAFPLRAAVGKTPK